MEKNKQEQARSQRSRLRVLEAAVSLFAEKGYEGTSFQAISERAGVSVGLACRYFPTKEHLALGLYQRLALDLEEWATEMPEGTLCQRFGALMRAKLVLLTPHRAALTVLAVKALDPSGRAGVLSPSAEVTRSRVLGVFALAVSGASDAPPKERTAVVTRLLYGAHLALILLWVNDASPSQSATMEALSLVESMLSFLPPESLLDGPFGERLDRILGGFFGSARLTSPGETARLLLQRIFRRRRVLPGVGTPTEAAFALHLPRVQSFVDNNEPLQLVLPAFPAKSPNLTKVLGRLPDMGERLALESLSALLAELREAYPPGAELIICSDGLVFADAVGVSDADVARYRVALQEMIEEREGERIRIFGLEDAFGALKPAAARRALFERYAASVEDIQARAARSSIHMAQIDGIHRFLSEDELALQPKISRNQAKKQTRERAYEVVRRSDAWGNLVGAYFPRAVRLSIHPQPDVSPKIGIHLLPTEDEWLTPWHGAAVLAEDRFRLMRRSDAAAQGAVLVEEDGRPSYLSIPKAKA